MAWLVKPEVYLKMVSINLNSSMRSLVTHVWIGWWRPPHFRDEINRFVRFMKDVGAMLLRAVDWFRFVVNDDWDTVFLGSRHHARA